MTFAYRVPFRVDRTNAPAYRLVNVSDERLTGLRIVLLGSGLLLPISSLRLAPGTALTVVVRETDPSSSVLIVRWFRPNGEEYLWRVSF